uniref:SFRICE_008861 n=1 Tax=Spodoptera frugiperda TaxID=7108 RepID=A0A2H1VXJ6_SPOFR
MINRFRRSTKSCPSEQFCPDCIQKADPCNSNSSSSVSIPGSICATKKQSKNEPCQVNKLCQWHRRRKILNELNRITKIEKKRLKYLRREKTRQEKEAKALQRLIKKERELREAERALERSPEPDYGPNYSACYSKGANIGCKLKKIKNKGNVRPCLVCAMYDNCYTPLRRKPKKTRQKDSFNERFSNFCYRICCQFYCCVTVILILGIIFICFC